MKNFNVQIRLLQQFLKFIKFQNYKKIYDDQKFIIKLCYSFDRLLLKQ